MLYCLAVQSTTVGGTSFPALQSWILLLISHNLKTFECWSAAKLIVIIAQTLSRLETDKIYLVELYTSYISNYTFSTLSRLVTSIWWNPLSKVHPIKWRNLCCLHWYFNFNTFTSEVNGREVEKLIHSWCWWELTASRRPRATALTARRSRRGLM